MGGPSSRDAHRNNANNNNNDEGKEDENGEVKVVKSKKRRGRCRNGQVVRLEEQRRLRQEQEAQKEKLNSSVLTTEEDNVDDSNDADGGDDDDDDSDDETKQDNDQVDGEDNKNGNNTELNSDIQLASTFNTLRVLITILRPILDHPHHNNGHALNMKDVPKNKKSVNYYMISTHVYSPVSKGEWNDTRLSFVRMLNEVEPGLFHKVMKRVNGDTEYEFNVKEWTVGLFNHDQLSSKEYVAKQSIGEDLLEACKDSNHIIHKFNNVLLDRFQNDSDEKKQRKLQESIRNLQNKLSKAISRNFPD
eukprot:scaffold36197_cov155-Skeletonema_dohrnii-CCMP3373.AAC.1